MPVDRQAAEAAIEAFLRAIGRDPELEPELEETGARTETIAFAGDVSPEEKQAALRILGAAS